MVANLWTRAMFVSLKKTLRGLSSPSFGVDSKCVCGTSAVVGDDF